MLRSLLAALAAGAALIGASAAHAGTQWSIGIHVPATGVVVSHGPRYYVEPAPVYYAPPPVVRYVPRHRHVYREVHYVPAPQVVYRTSYRGDRRWDRDDDDGRWEGRHGRHRHHHRWDHDHVPHRGR